MGNSMISNQSQGDNFVQPQVAIHQTESEEQIPPQDQPIPSSQEEPTKQEAKVEEGNDFGEFGELKS